MEYYQVIETISDILKEYDNEKPIHKTFQPGIGPFGEPQIVKEIAIRLLKKGIPAHTKRLPDLEIGHEWAIEFKIVRPFGDNGKEGLVHPGHQVLRCVGWQVNP